MSEAGKFVRRVFFAIIVFVILYAAWYGAEILIHGSSQQSYVDLAIAIMISISISGKLEKGAEMNDKRNEFAEKFTTELIDKLKEREEAQNGKDGSREQN